MGRVTWPDFANMFKKIFDFGHFLNVKLSVQVTLKYSQYTGQYAKVHEFCGVPDADVSSGV